MSEFDIIISGAGASGLSLAYYLSKSKWKNKKILLLDQDSKESNDRTWCYWAKEALDFQCAQQTSWQNLRFRSKDFQKTQNIHPYQYYYIKGSEFYQEIKKHLASFPNIIFRQEELKSIQEKESGVEVESNQAKYRASWLFNSIPQFAPQARLEENAVKQYFKGHFVETDRDFFEPDQVDLMDFSRNTKGNISFFYVLPFDKRKALVEYTVFSTQTQNPEQYSPYIEEYFQSKAPEMKYDIYHEEKGMIPMRLSPPQSVRSSRIIHLGAAGGMTKASTGYTFHNIQLFCQKLILDWQDFYSLPSLPERNSKRFRFYDQLFLGIIRHYPEQFPFIMERLFKQNKFPMILKFLDEQSKLSQEASLFASLPWSPFLKVLYEQSIRTWYKVFEPANWRTSPLGDSAHV